MTSAVVKDTITKESFQGHPRFNGMKVETVRGIVREFEAETTSSYDEFAARTRKRSYWASIKHNPVSPALLALAFYSMVSGTYRAFDNVPSFAYLMPVIASGIYSSSFISGLMHLFLDNVPLQMVPTNERPIVEFLAYGFQHHHAVQTNWSNQDVFAHGVLTIGTIGVMSAWLAYFLLHQLGWMSFEAGCGVLAYAFMILNVQVIHAFAHNTYKKSHPRFHAAYLMLARTGLLLDNKHHHQHHTLFDRSFCTTNSWADPVVDWIFQEMLRRGYIVKELHPDVQREVYIRKKRELVRPYFQLFPDWRFLHSLGGKITTNS